MAFLLFPLHGAILIIDLACLVVVVAALLDVALRPASAFLAADKQTKLLWIMFLVLGAFVILVGLIAAIVYFLDVRPALSAQGGSGSAPRRSSSDGPYGPSRR